MLGPAFWWIQRGSFDIFERDAGSGGLGRWVNLTCRVIPLTVSVQADPNYPFPYNFNIYFRWGYFIAGLVCPGLLSDEDQPLLVRWNALLGGGISC
jgi:hypothetical protein